MPDPDSVVIRRHDEAAFFGTSARAQWPGVAYLDADAGVLDTVGENVDVILDGCAAHGPTALRPIGLIAQMAAPIARLDDPARAARLYELVAPLAGQGTYIGYFAGPIDYCLGLACRTLGREDEAQRRFSDAAAFSERLGAPRWVERCRSAIGDLDLRAVTRR